MSTKAILKAFKKDPDIVHDIQDLTSPPKKDLTKAKFRNKNIKKNTYHSMDLLYLTHDGDYKYLLVIVDVATRAVDAEPLKERDGDTVYTAFKKIYAENRKPKYLNTPHIIHMDAGTEFSKIKEELPELNIAYRVASTNRHSQQAVVEAMNKIIGTTITKLQLYKELEEHSESHAWVQYLPTILKR